MRVLIVEDSIQIAANIGEYLEIMGHSVDFSYTGQAALELLSENQFDVMILDIMMPGLDGLSTCRKIREQGREHLPILFLTACDTLEDKLAGFAAGGDDYLVKPFAMQELLARLEALTLRSKGGRSHEITFSGLTLSTETEQAFFQNNRLKLDPLLFKLLKTLLLSAPRIVHKQDLEYELWHGETIDSSVLRTHIYRLRKVLPEGLLETVRGKGYRLNEIN
ncbi:Response regulator MprA [Allocatenococcus thiocycli]|nr:Response regulator MprA [Catenococcus thiocycli]